LPISWALPYEPNGLDCQRGQTGCLDNFISAKVVKSDYLAATKTVLTVDEIALATDQKNIFF
jgi:predicted NBD/HSP70 family sugar kinase